MQLSDGARQDDPMAYRKEAAASIACMSVLQEHEVLCPSMCKIVTGSFGDTQVQRENFLIISPLNPIQHNLFYSIVSVSYLALYFQVPTHKLRAPGQSQAQKGTLKRVEARTGILGGIQRNCPSSQGTD